MKYAKDNGKYNKPVNFSFLGSKPSDTSLALINTCHDRWHKDANGIYKYKAVSYNDNFDVTFKKVYVKIDDNGFIREIE
jgi:hypothetical protein